MIVSPRLFPRVDVLVDFRAQRHRPVNNVQSHLGSKIILIAERGGMKRARIVHNKINRLRQLFSRFLMVRAFDSRAVRIFPKVISDGFYCCFESVLKFSRINACAFLH